MGRRSQESKRIKRRHQKARRFLKFKDTYSRSSVDLQTEETTANESDVTEKTEEEASVYKQIEFGVDLAAEELRLEDELKDRDVEYTYEYLSNCRQKLRTRLEHCHQKLEEAKSINVKQNFQHRREIENIQHFYQTIAYAKSRTGRLVRSARLSSSAAAAVMKELEIDYGM